MQFWNKRSLKAGWSLWRSLRWMSDILELKIRLCGQLSVMLWCCLYVVFSYIKVRQWN